MKSTHWFIILAFVNIAFIILGDIYFDRQINFSAIMGWSCAVLYACMKLDSDKKLSDARK